MTDSYDYDPADPYRTGPPRGCWERFPFRRHRTLEQVMLNHPVIEGPIDLVSTMPGVGPACVFMRLITARVFDDDHKPGGDAA